MVNPFAKRRVTKEERDEILKAARKTWDSLKHPHVLGVSDVEYLAAVDDGLEIIGSEFVVPQPLTAAEKSDFEARLSQSIRMENFRMTPEPQTGVPAIDKAWEEKEEAEMRTFLQPVRDAESALNKMIEETVARVLRKASGESSLPPSGIRIPSMPERQGLVPMLEKAREFSENSDSIRFLSAYVAGDEAEMRKLVRELVAA